MYLFSGGQALVEARGELPGAGSLLIDRTGKSTSGQQQVPLPAEPSHQPLDWCGFSLYGALISLKLTLPLPQLPEC